MGQALSKPILIIFRGGRAALNRSHAIDGSPVKPQRRDGPRAAEPQPTCAKRLECDQLAGAFKRCHAPKREQAPRTPNASRGSAPGKPSPPANNLDYCREETPVGNLCGHRVSAVFWPTPNCIDTAKVRPERAAENEASRANGKTCRKEAQRSQEGQKHGRFLRPLCFFAAVTTTEYLRRLTSAGCPTQERGCPQPQHTRT